MIGGHVRHYGKVRGLPGTASDAYELVRVSCATFGITVKVRGLPGTASDAYELVRVSCATFGITVKVRGLPDTARQRCRCTDCIRPDRVLRLRGTCITASRRTDSDHGVQPDRGVRLIRHDVALRIESAIGIHNLMIKVAGTGIASYFRILTHQTERIALLQVAKFCGLLDNLFQIFHFHSSL
ncbi:unnamed protein product [Trichogramma brassicae]|uniref:Uncharacterized protein n=1 Tax=Trichogramma brassicae TaxID=86971 RepID=A0A6H5IAB3_9HYME|nr:unnamed protein product [Trichogramma brassicae]